jgi:hypothetical protein
VDVLSAVTPLLVVAQDSTDEGYGLQAGPYAFFFFVALRLSLVFLLRSMRKQMRRIAFDEQGTTDAERMLGAPESGKVDPSS